MKRSVILLLALIISTCLTADNIDKSKAKKLAKNFYYERVNQYNKTEHSDIRIDEVIEIRDTRNTLMYAINIKGGGFVLVSAYTNVRPILGYAFSGKYTDEWLAPQFEGWLKRYKEQLRYAQEHELEAASDIKQMWHRLISDDISLLKPLKNEKDLEPLLTTQWDQGQYYNEMCPADPAGPGGHCYAGCVATTLGQLVNYFRWPESGLGSYTYSCPPYGDLTADFGNTTYEWDKMATGLNKSNLAVALLLHHLGISCDMVYGPNGSGMYNHKAAYTLRTHFKYLPSCEYVYRDSTTMDWDSLLISHLDRKIPLYYAGWSVPNINGHAFVCDGYQAGNYYHFNWGWSGSFDGYFYTDNLNPGGSNFNLAQELVMDGYPDTNLYSYPYYCQGDKLLDGTDGTIDDGSGPVFDYENNTSCSWLIAPEDSVENITLEFLHFNTADYDTVYIYDGEDANAPLLEFFQGPNLPGDVTSTGDKMFITFNSNDNTTADGWLLRYTGEIPVYCTGMTSMSEQTGTFTDGSGPRDYHNSTTCMWMITPPDANELTLYFTAFNTEEEYDLVKVFDLDTQELLAEYSGEITPDPVTSPSGSMFVTFSTNYTITAPGWDAYYETDLVSIEENDAISQLEIFPNPANNSVNLSWHAITSKEAKLAIRSMSGISFINKDIISQSGENSHQLDVSDLLSGVYIIEVVLGDEIYRKKLIIK